MSNKRFYNFLAGSVLLPSVGILLQAAEWTVTHTESTVSLRALVALSDREVWASGTNGMVLHTVDQGKHWTKITGVPENLDFRGLQTFDGRTVFLMSAGTGAKSCIYRTTDSGKRWTLVHQNDLAAAFFDSIAFYDALRGLIIGDPVNGRFFLLATSDGGATWSQLSGPAAREGEGAFAASNTSLVVNHKGLAWFGTGGALGGRVFNSYDWGRTWTAVSATIPHETASAGVFSLAFSDDRHGLATGGDYKKPADLQAVLSETNDGGSTWNPVEGPRGYRSAVSTDGHYLLVTGPDGSDFRATPKADWQPIAGEGFHALSVAPKGRLVWACGSKGRVAYFRVR